MFTKYALLEHMKTNSISIPKLASLIGISKHILYNVLSERSGCTEYIRKKIQTYIVNFL